MAITEKYASATGGGAHDGSDEANAWTLIEAFGAAVAGDRVNYKGDYTLAANLTATNAGTVTSPIILRGYNTTIGDGYLGRTDGHGPLIKTNMPIISNPGYTFQIKSYWIVESIYINGSYGSAMTFTNGHYSTFINSYSKTTAVAGGPTALNCDPCAGAALINSDFDFLSNAAGWTVNFNAAYGKIIGCRFKNTSSLANGHLACANTVVVDSIFGPLTPSGAVSINLYSASTSFVYGNTFYGIGGTAIAERNVAYAELMVYANNHITDSGKFIDNSYYATAAHAAIRFSNRKRDNTNVDRGFGDWPEYFTITTDTGGPETDFINASGYDFRLTSNAPGKTTGIPKYRNIGALQQGGTTSY